MLSRTIALAALAALLASPAWGRGSARIAALQTGLARKGMYTGPVDGVLGPTTEAAVRHLQRIRGLSVDGVPGPKTRRALGSFGRHPIGSRVLMHGARGWDVAALQFELAWHGFPSGQFDGVFGTRLARALRSFQTWAALAADGAAGASTLAALRQPPPHCPIALGWPLQGGLSSPFGPRGLSFHAGIDIMADTGTPVAASRSGRVVFAGWNDGFGQLVELAHHHGVVTFYAHLSRIDVSVGQRVAAGTTVGLVGSTGDATGPHLHFEVRVRGASVDPLPALP